MLSQLAQHPNEVTPLLSAMLSRLPGFGTQRLSDDLLTPAVWQEVPKQ